MRPGRCVSHAVGGAGTTPATRSVAGIFAARGRRASHESISLIASARHRYVQGWGYDVIPPRSLAMGVVGIVYVCVPLLREKVVCAQRAPRATPPRARRGRGREEGLPRRPGRRPSPARLPRRPGGACAVWAARRVWPRAIGGASVAASDQRGECGVHLGRRAYRRAARAARAGPECVCCDILL